MPLWCKLWIVRDDCWCEGRHSNVLSVKLNRNFKIEVKTVLPYTCWRSEMLWRRADQFLLFFLISETAVGIRFEVLPWSQGFPGKYLQIRRWPNTMISKLHYNAHNYQANLTFKDKSILFTVAKCFGQLKINTSKWII